MELNQVSSLLKAEIQESMAMLLAGYPMSEMGRLINTLSLNFQGLAICYLLIDSNRSKFQENLIRSGHGRLYYLEKSQKEGNDNDRWLSISRSESILDLIAAGQLVLAGRLVDLSTAPWKRSNEYEDDYLYFSIIHSQILQILGKPVQDVGNMLNRFAEVLDGASSGRLDVCRALLQKDDDAFFEAMTLLLEQRAEKIEKRKRIVISGEAIFWPRSFVSIEGVALMNLAQLLNMSVPNEFTNCPRSARCAVEERIIPNLFAELEALI